ncbi:MAG: hypothetical protein JWL63_2211 [Rhodocyclales bacterium]|nr:hypothetical protein [Rhodocyclales bacterium]
MASSFLSTDEFFGSLETIERVALSLSTPESLKPTQLPVTNSVACACTVLLSGYFENFLKDIVKEYIEELNMVGKPLTAIPFSMRVRHYSGGAEALAWAIKKDKDLATTAISQDLSRRLGSLDKTTGYVLAWEAFANTKSNPGTATVSAILAGLEIQKAWEEIHSLQKSHGRLDTFLGTFIPMRNVCAHTGSHHTPPSGNEIAEYVEKFRAIAECIDLLIAVRLEEFRKP